MQNTPQIGQSTQSSQHIFTLTGIDCPSCATRIETALEALPHTQSASFDFSTNRLYIHTSNLKAALECVTKIKPDSVLTPVAPLTNTSSTKTSLVPMPSATNVTHHFSESTTPTSATQSTHEHSSHLGFLCMLFCAFTLCMGLLYLPSLAQILDSLLLPFINLESTQPSHALAYTLLLALYLVAGKPIFLAAYANAKNKIFFDENTLMFVATLAALCLGEVSEAVAVMLFFRLGEFVEESALQKSKASINALLAIMPEIAHRILPHQDSQSHSYEDCHPSTLQKNDLILIKVGEKVPTDGIIIKGKSYLDMSSINGESTPVGVKIGDTIAAGAINTHSVLEMRVTDEFQNSHIAKIAALTQMASANKAKTQKLITRFAQIYTPIVFVLAVLIAIIPPLLVLSFPQIFGGIFGVGQDFMIYSSESSSILASWQLWHEWIYRALVVLMISCPCALVIAIPLGYFAALGNASSKGALFKGSIHLESLAQTKNIFFDKTGTLTKGSFEIVGLYPKGISEHKLLTLASCAEAHSSHPIATCITKSLSNTYTIESYEEKSGMGIIANLAQNQNLSGQILCGNEKLMAAYKVKGFEWEQEQSLPHTFIHLAHNGVYVGSIAIGDTLKPEAKEVIESLKRQGIKHFAILSGDRQASVDYVARELGIEHAYGELLPAQKYEILVRLKAQWAKENSGKSAFVGDGINDCIVLKGADVGISINTGGNDISKENADIILQSLSLRTLSHALHIAKRTQSITWQNISFALGSKLILALLGVFGIANMWLAIFGDVGIALLAMVYAKRNAR